MAGSVLQEIRDEKAVGGRIRRSDFASPIGAPPDMILYSSSEQDDLKFIDEDGIRNSRS